ncbi:transmembrane protein [Achlya hypogyna]|uniref:Copper transport protein n=1 Tax=Achlya hypogyna TaxID=1202772 RepID=A0A1V9ZLX0_ACHHY|nr:transmembrane protein [Achlya hypogyna]
MAIVPELNQSWKGNQAVYGCEMAGHMELLRTLPARIASCNELNLGIDLFFEGGNLPKPYVDSALECPVCGKPNPRVAIPWGYHGNQKIFACSPDHAQSIIANPTAYYAASAATMSAICERATVMFDGFQSFVGSSCPKLFLTSWVLSSKVKYALGFAGVVAMGVFLEWLGEYRESLERRLWMAGKPVYQACDQKTPRSLPTTTTFIMPSSRLPLTYSLVLAGLYMTALTVGYLLMLVAMLYETGLFAAAILGLGLGFYLFKDTEQAEMSGNIDPCCST